jgi:glycosyltransferase involved in cell wall biosynthesis
MIVLIPAYEPSTHLVDVVHSIKNERPWITVIVVDDGSGVRYSPVFDEARAAGAKVIGYPTNHGKGHALKTGFRYALSRRPGEAIVTADSDGQHSATDILRVADRVTDRVVLGGRAFDGDVPARSRFGNWFSRWLFRLSTGVTVHDTQTGLRGFPAALVNRLVHVPGERFEYEQNVLLELSDQLDEIQIETIYLEQNGASHFRPILDSMRVLMPVLRFGLASLTAFLVDTVLLQLLFALSGNLLLSVIGARLVSASTNFLANRHLVFRASGSMARHALRYIALALVLLAASYGSLQLLTGLGLPLLVAKLISEVALYLVSFAVQRRFVFRRTQTRSSISVMTSHAPSSELESTTTSSPVSR